MAQVDTSIYGNLLRPPKSVGEYAAEMDQAEQNRLGLQQSRMNLLSAQQAQQDQQALRQLYQQPEFNPQTDEGIKQLMRISPQAGAAAMKARQDALKAQADLGHVSAQTGKEQALTEKAKLETQGKQIDMVLQAVSTARDQPSYERAIEWLRSNGVELGQVPPQFDPNAVAQFGQMAMTAKERNDALIRQAQLAEQGRHNRATEGLTARGQNMTDTRQREANEINRSLTNEKKQMEVDALKRQKDGAISSAANQIDVIDKALAHPGLETSVGLSGKLDPRNYVQGTDAADFRAVLNQIGGSAFLQAFESLKGGGQITEMEGKKATDAIARLDRAQSDEEFKQSLNDLRQVMADGYRRLSGRDYGKAPPAGGASGGWTVTEVK